MLRQQKRRAAVDHFLETADKKIPRKIRRAQARALGNKLVRDVNEQIARAAELRSQNEGEETHKSS